MALKTPCSAQPNPTTTRKSYVGGVRRDKAGRPVRISPHDAERVFSATGASLIVLLMAGAAWAADPPQAPSVQPAPTSAAATPDTASSSEPPKKWPPPSIQVLSPSAPLGPKERHGLSLVHRWQNRNVMPAMGPRGEVRFLYGATMPTIVCAPLQLTNVALQPGEIVQKLDLGDPVMWQVSPGISGSGTNQVTHLLIKASDAGLITTLDVETNRRSYAIRLVSHQRDFMPLVAFNYPEDQVDQWAAYQQAIGVHAADPPPDAAGYLMYQISGDNPAWRPLVVYSDRQKTYIEFPPAMAYGTAPVLEKTDGGGLFRGPSTEVVNFRSYTNPQGGIFYIYDGVLDRAELISGVGGSRTRVMIERMGG